MLLYCNWYLYSTDLSTLESCKLIKFFLFILNWVFSQTILSILMTGVVVSEEQCSLESLLSWNFYLRRGQFVNVCFVRHHCSLFLHRSLFTRYKNVLQSRQLFFRLLCVTSPMSTSWVGRVTVERLDEDESGRNITTRGYSSEMFSYLVRA